MQPTCAECAATIPLLRQSAETMRLADEAITDARRRLQRQAEKLERSEDACRMLSGWVKELADDNSKLRADVDKLLEQQHPAAPSPDEDEHVWVAEHPDGHCSLVTMWHDGTVTVAEEPRRHAGWGPPAVAEAEA